MAEGSPAQKVSDEELKRAIEQKCQLRGTPVVTTSQITDVDYVNVKDGAAVKRLKKLAKRGEVNRIQSGSGSVWWVDEDEATELRGEVDFSNIAWENIPAEDIPVEKVEQHPEIEIPSEWEARYEKLGTVSRAALFAISVGLITAAIVQNLGIPLLSQADQEFVGRFALWVFLGGILFLGGAILWSLVLRGIEWICRSGYYEALRELVTSMFEKVESKLPFSYEGWE
jgi:hypothetical protein